MPEILPVETEVILQKIESLERCIQRIESKMPFTLEALQADFDLQDVVVLNLERAVQQAVDIGVMLLVASKHKAPLTMSASFETLGTLGILATPLAVRMQKAVGFRNIAVHEYEKLSMDVVMAIVGRHLNDFRLFVSAIVQYMER